MFPNLEKLELLLIEMRIRYPSNYELDPKVVLPKFLKTISRGLLRLLELGRDWFLEFDKDICSKPVVTPEMQSHRLKGRIGEASVFRY